MAIDDSNDRHRDHEWFGYYERFPYFSPDKIRDGCQPRIMCHPEPADRAVVLVHGLSDSPHFMAPIGGAFFSRLGYDVYLPLLHCHGLKAPTGMGDVHLEEWKENVSFAITAAASRSSEVSVGGLSTGGTLSFYMAATNPDVTGALYLFSAALDLAGGRTGLIGQFKEWLAPTLLADLLLDSDEPLVDESPDGNPYRYTRVDIDGARELARLIKETDTIIERFEGETRFQQRVFAAHSECDTTASIAGIEMLERACIPERFRFFRIPASAGVSHASVVLARDIPGPQGALEKANPEFGTMMDAIASFVG